MNLKVKKLKRIEFASKKIKFEQNIKNLKN